MAVKSIKKVGATHKESLDFISKLHNLPSQDTTFLSPISVDKLIDDINPTKYAKTRNYLDGGVTKISPFISRGIIDTNRVIDILKNRHAQIRCEGLFKQMAWRMFWRQVIIENPEYLWNSVEEIKTGWRDEDYASEVPDDISTGQTSCESINQIIRQLITSGYIHNHARLYLASYCVHWRRISWQAGAKWMYSYLIDGYLPSNNLSWQWVASTFSNKPYIFNLDNIKKFSNGTLDCTRSKNKELDYSYEYLHDMLFPKMESRL